MEILVRHLLVVVTTLFLIATNCPAQTITVVNDLVFGDLFPGVPKTISKYTAGEAAEFHVAGTNAAQISIQFTLPTKMTKIGVSIQLIFFDTDCSVDPRNKPVQTSPLHDNLDPWSTHLYKLGPKGLTIYLGCTAIPRIVQPPGAYTADIILTVAYTGA